MRHLYYFFIPWFAFVLLSASAIKYYSSKAASVKSKDATLPEHESRKLYIIQFYSGGVLIHEYSTFEIFNITPSIEFVSGGLTIRLNGDYIITTKN